MTHSSIEAIRRALKANGIDSSPRRVCSVHGGVKGLQLSPFMPADKFICEHCFTEWLMKSFPVQDLPDDKQS